MIHPHTELRFVNDRIGYGVFATQPIPMGTIVWTLCAFDRLMSSAEYSSLSESYRDILSVFAYVDSSDRMVLCWDHGRRVNHSCDPSMLIVGQDHEIAVRDLVPGDELTCDYGTFTMLMPSFACHCGAANCRGKVSASDRLMSAQRYDTLRATALQNITRVPQPLVPYMRREKSLSELMVSDQADI